MSKYAAALSLPLYFWWWLTNAHLHGELQMIETIADSLPGLYWEILNELVGVDYRIRIAMAPSIQVIYYFP